MKSISVIVPCYNEEKYIKFCIDSILNQDYPRDKMEVFFIDGMSIDKTRIIINEYCRNFPFIKLLDNEKKIVPNALNLGIDESKGDYIIRLDAHSFYPPDYFSKLIKYANKLDSDNIGGVCITAVKNIGPKSLAIREVLSNRFGIGNSLFRIGTDRITETDTVVFGCFKRNVFTRFGKYDERLIRNQDIELNKRIKRGGGKIYLVPDIECTYFARETFKDLMNNNFQNGLWNIMTVYHTKTIGSLSIRHLVPLFFVLSLIFPLLIAIIYTPILILAKLSLISYFFFFFLISLRLSIVNKLNYYYLFSSFFVLHLSYGLGSFIGLTRVILGKVK